MPEMEKQVVALQPFTQPFFCIFSTVTRVKVKASIFLKLPSAQSSDVSQVLISGFNVYCIFMQNYVEDMLAFTLSGDSPVLESTSVSGAFKRFQREL